MAKKKQITREDIEFLNEVFKSVAKPTFEEQKKIEEKEKRINCLDARKKDIAYSI